MIYNVYMKNNRVYTFCRKYVNNSCRHNLEIYDATLLEAQRIELIRNLSLL